MRRKSPLPELLCTAAVVAVYYLAPLAVRDTGGAMLLLLLLTPLTVLGASIWLGARNGFVWPLPFAAALLFAPTLLLYYNESAWVYLPVYAGICAVGLAAGWAIRLANRSENLAEPPDGGSKNRK